MTEQKSRNDAAPAGAEQADWRADLAARAVDYPEPAPPAEPAPQPPPTVRPLRARLNRLARDPRLYFLLAMAAVLAGGFWLRFWRLDMPPFDYPDDRQRSTMIVIDEVLEGRTLFTGHRSFMQFPLYSTLVAKTSGIAQGLDLELWTWARIVSFGFGMLTVALAGLVGYLLAAIVGASAWRRWWLGLFMMAALAVNPYHIGLSRMIMIESMMLALQAAALALFLLAMARPRAIYWHVAFLLVYLLAVMSKLPSLIWLPAYSIGYLALLLKLPINLKWRLGGLAAVLLAGISLLWLMKLNPFTLIPEYMARFPQHASETLNWLDHELWYRSFFGRVTMMLTLPGLVLGLVGLLTAPWLLRLTMLLALAGFYLLNNLNTYNFCHLILPGLALAAFGLMAFIDGGQTLRGRLPLHLPGRLNRLALLVDRGFGLALALVLIAVLWRFGPEPTVMAEPLGRYVQGARIIRELVPAEAMVHTDNRMFEYYPRKFDGRTKIQFFERPEPYSFWFYSFNRYGQDVIHLITNKWVRWASLPGEFRGLLLTTRYATIEPLEAIKYARLGKVSDLTVEGLDVEAVLLPHANTQQRILRVRAGESVSIGIQWNRTADIPLATLVARHELWPELLVPLPIREGGIVRGRGALVSVPRPGRQLARYTFEFPKGFPTGQYAISYQPLSLEDALQDNQRMMRKIYGLPFVIEVVPPADQTSFPIERQALDLYPSEQFWEAPEWNNARWWRDMRISGIQNASNVTRVLAAPDSPAGRYRLTLTGKGQPTYGPNPNNHWPSVRAILSNAPQQTVAEIVLNSTKTGAFSAEFTTQAPFNSVLLQNQVRPPIHGTVPTWLIDFQPTNYGPDAMQYITLETVRLERLSD